MSLVNLSKDDPAMIDTGHAKLFEEVVCTESEQLVVSYFPSDFPNTGRDFTVVADISPDEATEDQENEFLYW